MAPSISADPSPRSSSSAKGASSGLTSSLTRTDGQRASVRDLFPVTRETTYLNSCFQYPLNRYSRSKIDRFLDDYAEKADPKSAWVAGINDVRSQVATLIHADPSNVAFTKNTSEALNLFVHAAKMEAGDNVVMLDTEHPNQVYAWTGASKVTPFEIRQVAEDSLDRSADDKTFATAVDEMTKVIGISLVMFHGGQLNRIKSIASTYRSRGIKIVVDATQAIGFMDVDVQELGVDAVCFGIHKGLGVPAGLGVFWARNDFIMNALPLCPAYQSIKNARADLLAPAYNPEPEYWDDARRFEGGNSNYFALTCLAASLDLIQDVGGPKTIERHLRSLTDMLKTELGVRFPDLRIVTAQDVAKSSPHSIVIQLTPMERDWKSEL